MITPALYFSLEATFAKYAKYHAPSWGIDASEFLHLMWEAIYEKGARATCKGAPLFEATAPRVAQWATWAAIKQIQRDWRHVPLDERVSTPRPTYGDGFGAYIAKIGQEWGIDVSQALAVIDGHEVSPEFERYIRELGPQDKRIAALLLSGLRRSHIESAKLAPRRKTQEIHQQLYQILKAA